MLSWWELYGGIEAMIFVTVESFFFDELIREVDLDVGEGRIINKVYPD
jgi:hypothetical protein